MQKNNSGFSLLEKEVYCFQKRTETQKTTSFQNRRKNFVFICGIFVAEVVIADYSLIITIPS